MPRFAAVLAWVLIAGGLLVAVAGVSNSAWPALYGGAAAVGVGLVVALLSDIAGSLRRIRERGE